MASRTSVGAKDSLAQGNRRLNRAGRYLDRPSSAWCFDIGFKGRLTVRLFLLILERDLGGAGRVTGVIQAALDAEEDCANQNNSHRENGNRPAPGSALQTAIQKRQQKEQQSQDAGNHDDGKYYRSTLPELEPLKHRQVVPLGAGKKLRIRGIGDRTKRHRMKVGQDAQADHEQQGKGHVHDHLSGIETLRRQLGMYWIFLDRAGGASFAEQRNMHTDE